MCYTYFIQYIAWCTVNIYYGQNFLLFFPLYPITDSLGAPRQWTRGRNPRSVTYFTDRNLAARYASDGAPVTVQITFTLTTTRKLKTGIGVLRRLKPTRLPVFLIQTKFPELHSVTKKISRLSTEFQPRMEDVCLFVCLRCNSPPVGQGLLIHEVSISHKTTHHSR